MNIDTEQILKDLLSSLDSFEGIQPDEIPRIDLYMDQVTTFMDAQLSSSKRYETDKILTKTMINNYAKNRLLPPPVKKKYSPEHMLLLIFIYYFKNIFSITDIQTLLSPVTERFFKKDAAFSIEQIYKEVYSMEKDQISEVKKEILEKYEISGSLFSDAPEEDREFLRLFSFVCILSFDIYLKKQMLEKIVDDLAATQNSGKSKKHEK